MCKELIVGDYTVLICTEKEALKLSAGSASLDVKDLEEQEGGGAIKASQRPAVEAHVKTLMERKFKKVVNCKQGKHRSVVVAIVYLNRVAGKEEGGSIKELLKQAQDYVSKSALVEKSLRNMGYLT